MRGRWISAAVLVVASCAVEPLASRSQAIIGGDPTIAYPSTGVLVAASRLRCTATLIAPDVVVTAAHCLEPPAFGYLGFSLDADLTDGVEGIVKALVTHQHPDFDETGDELLDLAVRNDIGVMILEAPFEGVPVERIDLDAEIQEGIDLALCGYGRNEWSTVMAGVKRDARVVVDRMADFELATTSEGPQPCSGDSGGPLFVETPDARVLTGLVSRALGDSRMCDTGAIITRFAPYAAWIAQASQDRDTGCSAGGRAGNLVVPLALIGWLCRRRVRAGRAR